MLLAPPFGGLFAGYAEEPRTKRAAIRVEALRTAPDLGVNILHEIVGRIAGTGAMAKETAQARRRIPIPGFKSIGIALGNSLPEFPVVEQIVSPFSNSGGNDRKSSKPMLNSRS